MTTHFLALNGKIKCKPKDVRLFDTITISRNHIDSTCVAFVVCRITQSHIAILNVYEFLCVCILSTSKQFIKKLIERNIVRDVKMSRKRVCTSSLCDIVANRGLFIESSHLLTVNRKHHVNWIFVVVVVVFVRFFARNSRQRGCKSKRFTVKRAAMNEKWKKKYIESTGLVNVVWCCWYGNVTSAHINFITLSHFKFCWCRRSCSAHKLLCKYCCEPSTIIWARIWDKQMSKTKLTTTTTTRWWRWWWSGARWWRLTARVYFRQNHRKRSFSLFSLIFLFSFRREREREKSFWMLTQRQARKMKLKTHDICYCVVCDFWIGRRRWYCQLCHVLATFILLYLNSHSICEKTNPSRSHISIHFFSFFFFFSFFWLSFIRDVLGCVLSLVHCNLRFETLLTFHKISVNTNTTNGASNAKQCCSSSSNSSKNKYDRSKRKQIHTIEVKW